jgi:hypothetical protein
VTYNGGIYNWSAEYKSLRGMMAPQPPAVFIVPGMRVGCLPYHAIEQATLECFFDETCLNATARLISSLPADRWPTVLNVSMLTKFKANTSIQAILKDQMVEEWTNETSFSKYYDACSPIQCTYTFQRRNDLIAVLTTLIGLFGGLMVSMRILAPLLVQLAHRIRGLLSRKQQTSTDDEQHAPGNSFTHGFASESGYSHVA